jgi:tRNA(Ile)-lysidine synthase
VNDVSILVPEVGIFLERHGLPRSGVVGVSGGPDSVALLFALVELRGSSPAGPLVIGHINHQLRGTESEADEAFVRDLYTRLVESGVPGVALRCERDDARAEAARQRANLEAHARTMRYAVLQRFAEEAGVRWVATGHTADDQAETVLHRLLRGAGLKGLRGIPARRPIFPGSAVELVRPLLEASRSEVLAFLAKQRQTFRQDRSNADLSYTRNRIRHGLLPLLKDHYNPAVADVLARLAEQAAEVYQAEEQAARALLEKAERPRAGRLLIFDRRVLQDAPRRLVREAFRLAWERERWPQGGMGFHHWDRLVLLVVVGSGAADFPGGIRGRALPNVVQVGPAR